MLECVTEAIVLDTEDRGEFDIRVFLYTQQWGKIIAYVTSARKISSKLHSHLELFNVVTVRVVHKNKTRIVDALVTHNARSLRDVENIQRVFRIFQLVNTMTQEWSHDNNLWSALKEGIQEGNISSRRVLDVLGFDPRFALCQLCHKKPTTFLLHDQQFYCRQCVDRYMQHNTLLSHTHD